MSEGQIKYTVSLAHDQFDRDSAKVKKMLQSVGTTAVKQGQDIDSIFSKVGRGAAVYLSGRELISFGKEIANVRGEFQQLEISFETMLKSKAKADKLMKEVVDFAAMTPYELSDVGKGAKQLLAFQVPADKITDKLRQIGDLASGANVPLNELVSAYGKVKAKGKMQAEEMNMFLERGIPLVSELAKKYGTTEAAIYKMGEQGKLGINDLNEVMAQLTGESGMFYNLMEEQSKSIPGMISNLSDNVAQMMNEIGTANQGAIEGIIEGGQFAVDHYGEIASILKTLVVGYGSYKAAVIATAAVKQASQTVQLQQEGIELSKLISKEELRALGVKDLTRLTKEETSAIKTSLNAQLYKADIAQKSAKISEAASKKIRDAALEEYDIANELVNTQRKELSVALESKDAKRIATAQTELATAAEMQSTAIKKKNIAVSNVQVASTNLSSSAKKRETLTTQINTATDKGAANAKNILSLATLRLGKAFKSMKATLLSNPFGILMFAITALIPLFIKMIAKQKEATEQQERLNEAIKDAGKEIDAETAKLDAHFARLEAAKKGTDEYKAARKSIFDKYGDHLKSLGDENVALNDTALAYRVIKDAILETAQAKAYERTISEAADDYAENQKDNKEDLKKTLEKKFKGKTDANGKDLAEVYYWKFIPVLEGKEEMTDELQGIYEEFDQTRIVSGEFGSGTSYIVNELGSIIGKGNEASVLLEDLTKKANEWYGSGGDSNNQNDALDNEIARLEKRKNALKYGTQEVDVNGVKTPDYLIEINQGNLDKVNAQLEELYAKKKELEKEGPNEDGSEDESPRTVDVIAQEITNTKKLRSSKSETSKEYIAYTKDIIALEKELKGITEGQIPKSKMTDYISALAKQKEDELRIRKEQQFEITQAEIDAQADGIDKKLAQNELNYQKELEQLHQQKMDRLQKLQENEKTQFLADGGDEKEFKSNVTFSSEELEYWNKKEKQSKEYRDNNNQADIIANQESLNKLFSQYDGYISKRKKLNEKYNKDLDKLESNNADGSQDDRIKELTIQRNDELSTLDTEAQGVTGSIGQLFADMSEMSLGEIRKLSNEGKELLDYLASGNYSADNKFGLTEEQFKANAGGTANFDFLSDLISKSLSTAAKDIESIFLSIGDVLAGSGDSLAADLANISTTFINMMSTMQDSSASTGQKVSGIISLVTVAGTILKDAFNDIGTKTADAQAETNLYLAEQLGYEQKINDIKRERLEIERNASAFYSPTSTSNYQQAISDYNTAVGESASALSALQGNALFSATGTADKKALGFLKIGEVSEEFQFSMNEITGIMADGETDAQNFWKWVLDPGDFFGTNAMSDAQVDAYEKLGESFNSTLTSMGKTSADLASFSTEDWADFYALMEEGGHITDEGTQQMVDNMQAAVEAQQAALEQMRDVISDVAGSLYDSLGDALVSSIQDGTDALDIFKSSVNDLLIDLAKSKAMEMFLNKSSDLLQEEMDASMQEGGDGDWSDDLKRYFENLPDDIKKATDFLEDYDEGLQEIGYDGITGADATSSSQTAKSGGFEAMTSSEAGVLEARFTGMFQESIKTNAHLTAMNTTMDEVRGYSLISINHLAAIEKNTANTVLAINTSNTRLSAIEKSLK